MTDGGAVEEGTTSPSWPSPPRQAEPSPSGRALPGRALSFMAGPSPSWPGSTRPSTRTRRRAARSALLSAPSVVAWMPASRAGMTDGSVLAEDLHPLPRLARGEGQGGGEHDTCRTAWTSPSWPGLTRPSTRTRRRRYGAALRASSSIACGRVDARLEGGHDGGGRGREEGAVERKARTSRQAEPSPSWPSPPRQAEPSPVGPSPSWPGPPRHGRA